MPLPPSGELEALPINKTKCCATRRRACGGQTDDDLCVRLPEWRYGKLLHRWRLCVSDVGDAACFLDQREYWYPNPPTGTPAFSVSGKYVYEHPASSTPRYYLG
jgi:hypothetical protein